MDILQKAIIDANKMTEVAKKAAEKALHQKFSKELKKLYLEEASGLINDPDIDDSMLEEYNFNLNEFQNPNQLEDPNAEMQIDGMPGQEGQGQEDSNGGGGSPLDSNQLGTEPNSGMSPQNPVTDITGNKGIPFSHSPDAGSTITITFDDPSNPFEASTNSFDQMSNDVQGDTDSFLTNQNTLDTGNTEIGPDQNNEDMIDFEDEGNQTQDPNDNNPFNLTQHESKKPSSTELQLDETISVSDEILLEYIDRALTNDQKVKDLAVLVEALQATVSKVTTKLEDSTKTLESLKEQNIRLIYQNKTLNDVSLSENQKQSIVKALDKAKTIDEAKTIFEATKITSKNISKTTSNVNSILTPSAGRKMTEESANMLKESREPSSNRATSVLRENKEKIPSILEKLYSTWGIK